MAEDDCAFQFLLHNLLSAAFPRCSIATFSTAEDAFHHILDSGTDVLITDHGMGTMSGTELVRELREQGFHTPIIVLSGDPGIEKEARLAGADVFLEKKPNCRELEQHIRKLLTHSRGSRRR